MERSENHAGSLTSTIFFCLCIAILSWFMIQVVHEAGHLLGAWWTGTTVVQLILHPLRISETIVQPRPAPVPVIWAGPVVGIIIPILMWRVAARWNSSWLPCWQFFAGFCLITNGAYLGMGVWNPVGDAHDLIQAGTPRWQLGLFGLITMITGLRIWDLLPAELRTRKILRYATWRRTLTLLTALLIVVTLEIIWSQISPDDQSVHCPQVSTWIT